MPHYKDQAGKVHFLENASHAAMLPAGCVEITNEEAAALVAPQGPGNRRAEIAGRLMEIDAASIRPAREISAALSVGQLAPDFAKNKLAALEYEAATLRAELAALNA